MDPIKTRLAQLATEAAALRAKALGGGADFTEADANRAKEIAEEHALLTARLKARDGLAGQLSNIGGDYSADGTDHSHDGIPAGPLAVAAPSGRAAKVQTFVGGIMDAFRAAAPTIGGPYAKKALIPDGAVSADFTGLIVADPKATFDILNAIGSAQVEAPKGTYLRQSARTNNAATVVSGDLKPISNYELTPQTWEICSIPHLTNPIQRQWLADYTGLQTFLSTELAYGLNEALADFVLNGGESEDGNAVTGILNTTGISTVAYTTSVLRTIRKGLGELEAAGVNATGIILNPTDWEAIETALDGEGRFLMPVVPGGSASRQLWNVPVTLATGMTAGLGVVGDLKTVMLLSRSGMQLTWTESTVNTGTEADPVMTDLFRKNQVQFRAELRAGIEILSTPSLRKLDLTA